MSKRTHYLSPPRSFNVEIGVLKVDLDSYLRQPNSIIFCRRTTTDRPLHNGINVLNATAWAPLLQRELRTVYVTAAPYRRYGCASPIR